MKLTSKVWIIFISLCAGLFLVNFATYAQSFFGAGQKSNNPPSPTTPAIPPSRVLSPEEFNKIANQVSQQNTATLTKEAQQNIPKITPQQSSPTSKTSPALNAKPNTAANPATSPTTPNTDNSLTTNASSATPSTAPAAPKQPASTQIYTGFGSGTPNTQQNGDSGANSSGNSSWRIQY